MSIVGEPDGSRSVLIPYRGERFHAKIVDSIPTDAKYTKTYWTSMGYDIYQKKSPWLDQWESFIAIKPENVKENITMKVPVDKILDGQNVRSVLLKEDWDDDGFIYTVQPGDYIRVDGERAIVRNIISQDVYIVVNPGTWRKSSADVEFEDEKGNYRHWQSWSDGGTLITNDGTTYRFKKES